MKTLDEVKKERAQLLETYQDKNAPVDQAALKVFRKGQKDARKRLPFLKDAILYLETSPRKEFIEKQRGEVKVRVAQLEASLPAWVHQSNSKEAKDAKKKHFAEGGMKTLRRQLAALNYLLS